MMTGPIASPSSPSVRFTAFEAPTTTSSANGIHEPAEVHEPALEEGDGQHRQPGARPAARTRAAARRRPARPAAPNLTRAREPLAACAACVQSSQTPMSPKPRGRQDHHPHVAVRADSPTAASCAMDRRQDDDAAHRRRALLRAMPLGRVLADRLAAVLRRAQPPDQPRADHQRDDERRDQRHERPEGQIAEDVEEDVVSRQRDEEVVEHPPPFHRAEARHQRVHRPAPCACPASP